MRDWSGLRRVRSSEWSQDRLKKAVFVKCDRWQRTEGTAIAWSMYVSLKSEAKSSLGQGPEMFY